MLSLGEVHGANMGLSRGGGYRSDYGRDAFGNMEVGGNNVLLQQQLNDLIQNSYLLQQNGLTQCPSLSQTMDGASLLPPGGAGSVSSGFAAQHSLTSMGFSQSDIDRSMLFEDFPPVVDHQSFVSVSNAHASVATFAPVGLATESSYAGLPAMSLQPQISRERWVDATLTSPRELKREGELDQISLQPARKITKLDKSARTMDAKSKRPTEQADHILRERQRRDDMTSKFAVLESLLPNGVKRDRSTIVDDSIEYVKNLHHRIKSLQERKVELNNQSAAGATSNDRRGRKAEVLQQPSHGSPIKKGVATRRPRISEAELSAIHDVLRSCLEKMEVHADLPHQVVIEMVCKPQPRLQSNILLCLENLDLDVMQCSITKIAHRLICVITAKPQAGVNTGTSGIIAALKCALQG
ncbi:hypothetical protein KC19_9G110300 [Ceratodon purpureus]|uniref:BHLH domain-containing protein n=1 Tax=Ceratodon purpureus TaxID=3225 RepID=A0A8T0GQW0_CERPU|nr:hypothetical protein KC19_9G110300 [Ceratodon purpureus]